MSVTAKLFERNEIDELYKWNAESIFATPEEWEENYTAFHSMLGEFEPFKGHLGDSPESLLSYFQVNERIAKIMGKLTVYAVMSFSVDTVDQAATSRNSRARALAADWLSAISYADPEILEIPRHTLLAWMDSHPGIKTFSHYFQRLDDLRSHIRSSEIEELLGQVQDPFRSATMIHSTITDTDMRFQPAVSESGESLEIVQGNIGALLTHSDRNVRQTAWEHYADGYLSQKNSLAVCLSSGVKQNVFTARARHYPTSLHAALGPQQIPVEVFHNLIDVFKKSLGIWHRYWRLRRKALGYKSLYVYDIKASLSHENVVVPYKQAVEWISEGMAPLGEKYVTTMKKGLNEQRWVDVYPNRGKRSGAFSSGSPGTYPFIMMSYNDDVYGLSTLAHELGHSMHSHLSWETQPFIYSRYSLFVAEVASNFNQALVRAYLLEKINDRNLLIAIIEEAMSNFHRYLFIMPTLARFELEIHSQVEKGQALTAQSLNQLMADLFAEGYGDEVVMDFERVGITWAQFPIHMYMNFYVYQYATGIAGAHALSKRVLDDDPGAVDRYLLFLKTGGSLYPLDALKLAGVDLSKLEVIETAFQILDEMIDKLEVILDE